jgi:tetratricopeptide (TPR) repeat protein
MKMKKLVVTTILSALALLIMVGNVQAQKKYVNKAIMWAESGEKLDTALKSVIFCESQEKTKDWYKTYYAKGLVYEAISKTQDNEFKKLSDQPLIEAYDNYAKAYNMEGSNSIHNSVDVIFISLSNAFVNKGVELYQAEDYEGAFKYFEKTTEIKKNEVFEGQIDTAIIFNTAMAAQRMNNYDAAIKNYKISIEYNYGEGDTYSLLAENYKLKEDNELYISTLKEGFEKYPSNQALLGNIINYYLLEVDNTEEAFKYLALARETDPTNPQFYFAEAQLYDKTGDKEKAKTNYRKAIELDEKFFLAYYNLGVIYFNEGVALIDKANEIKDNTKYEKAKNIADDKFLESLPYLEKAHELEPDNTGITNTLKTLYYRLKTNHPELNAKYEAISNI